MGVVIKTIKNKINKINTEVENKTQRKRLKGKGRGREHSINSVLELNSLEKPSHPLIKYSMGWQSHSKPATGCSMSHLPALLMSTRSPEEPHPLSRMRLEKLARTVFSELPHGGPEWAQLLLG